MKRLVLLFFVATVGLLLAGCFWEKGNDDSGSGPLVVKIAQVSPLTGSIAHLGKDCENGVALAVHELNKQNRTLHGRRLKFELLSLNDMDDPRRATEAAQRVVDSGAVAIVGHLNSGATLPASPIYAHHKITEITVSSNIRYTKQGFKTAFRIMAADRQQGRAISLFAINKINLKRVVVIDDQTAYGRGLADIFIQVAKKNSVESPILTREYVDSYANDFGALLAKIRLLNPDAIFFGGTDSQSVPLLRQMRQSSIKIPMLTGDMSCMTSFMDQVSKVAAPFYCSTNGSDSSRMPGYKEFYKSFKEFFGSDPLLYSPYTYDAAMLIADAVRDLQTLDSAKIAIYLHDNKIGKRYRGVTGDISFDEEGNRRNVGVSIYTARDGKLYLKDVIFS
ncbi:MULTISPECIES: branched-chain amino acid ABC transporter substrate-binding protein [Candidatus Ichthyocystis]|uniref:Putative branched-chain amino acid ABC transporter substrate-binding protein n=1 Tax=Candidatus Ichthyocystis hellenicum TaxID=1561003 RepID=A0A0S4LZL1_9BURK|nr:MULTISPECIES: branched-chain amino acid ABC transporter substrate-binding protein [Ichthyocystis]CUT16999.1 putative branched-chain amino acid ABC transporter substrate-binding protein [Candidatus Ichthyocystis hellenicum]